MSREETLTKTFCLPLAAERDLDDVLRHEIDRTSPFSNDEIAFDYEVLERDQATGLLKVMVVIVARDRLASRLGQLRTAGIRPARVTVSDSSGTLLGIDLLEHRAVRRLPFAYPAVQPRYVVAVMVAFLVALYVPLIRYQSLDTEYRLAADEARHDAASARAAAEENDIFVEQAVFLDSVRSSYMPPMTILAELSQELPDDAWLSRFSVTQEHVHLQGEASGASRLLELVTRVDFLERAEFQSPVALSPTTGKESFSVTARIRRAGAP